MNGDKILSITFRGIKNEKRKLKWNSKRVAHTNQRRNAAIVEPIEKYKVQSSAIPYYGPFNIHDWMAFLKQKYFLKIIPAKLKLAVQNNDSGKVFEPQKSKQLKLNTGVKKTADSKFYFTPIRFYSILLLDLILFYY